MTLLTPRGVAVATAVLTGSLCLMGSARAADGGKFDPSVAPGIGQYAYDALARNVRTGITRKCVDTAFWTPQTATFECAPDLFATGSPQRRPHEQAAETGRKPGAQTAAAPREEAPAKESAGTAQARAEGEQPSAAQAGQTKRPAVVAMPTPSGRETAAPPVQEESAKAAPAEQPAATREAQAGAAAVAPTRAGAQVAPVTQAAEGVESKRSEMAPSSAAEGVPSQPEEQGGIAEREQAPGFAPATGPGAAQPEQEAAAGPSAGEGPMQAARSAETPEAGATPTTSGAQRQAEAAVAAPQQAQSQAPQEGAPETAAFPPASTPGAAQPSEQEAARRVPLVLPLTITVETNPLFDFDRITLRPDSEAKLDGLIAKLKGVQYAEIVAVGYADPIGTVSYNFALSERRAQSVEDYLEEKGVPAAKVEIEGRGETEEYASLSNCGGLRREPMIACLEPDRRVEVTVVPTSQ